MKRGWTLGASPGQVLGAFGFLAARRAALLRAGVELQGEWKDVLNQPGGGAVYPKGLGFITRNGKVVPVKGSPGNPGRSAQHRASAPGEPPAPDLGTLRNSIAVAEMGDEVRVGTGLRYGLALEYGVNVSGSRTGPHPGANFVLQPRPHARPAAKAARDQMTSAIRLVMLKNARRRGSIGG